MKAPAGSTYEFGPFEVNPSSGELLRHGRRVKLQEQPFQLLVILLENAGQLVSREQIQNRIWQGNTFVDFDSSLRVAVRKLREALGDDADHPRYIETIPKRGYRFMAPAPRTEEPLLRQTEILPAATKPAVPPARGSRWSWAIVVMLVIALVAASFRFHKQPRKFLTANDTVVVADFVNTTGDPVFDGTLRQGLEAQLEQSPFLGIIPEERIQQTLRLMGQPTGASLTPIIAREICERTGSAAVLEGSIASLGGQYVLGLEAKDCQSGKVLAEEQTQAAKKEAVLAALGQVATRFRIRVGESLATVEKHNTPLAEATTPSLEALKAYSTGLQVNATAGESAAVPFFKSAVEIDPQFAMAYAALGLMYGATAESALAVENTSKAYALRDRVTDKEKYFIAGYYDGRVTGNQEKAQQTCETWARVYPREIVPHTFLAGFIYPASGKYEKSVEEDKKALELDPDNAIGYTELAANYAALNRPADSAATLRLAADRKLDIQTLLVLRYDLAFLTSDQAEMNRVIAQAQGKTGEEDWVADHEAWVLTYSGHLLEARKMSEHAAALAQQAAHQERAAIFKTRAALSEGFLGNSRVAVQSARAALGLAKNREIEYGSAFALAQAGNSSEAQALANDLEKTFPEDTAVRFSYLPSLRALIALHRAQPAQAIESLQTAIPYELGEPRSYTQGSFGALYPIYVRGEAYLAAGRGPEAATEFQKILDHRGIVLSDPIGALARLQLGRAFALSANKVQAKAAYENFLSLWKDADPDIPVLKQAKEEYARLRLLQ